MLLNRRAEKVNRKQCVALTLKDHHHLAPWPYQRQRGVWVTASRCLKDLLQVRTCCSSSSSAAGCFTSRTSGNRSSELLESHKTCVFCCSSRRCVETCEEEEYIRMDDCRFHRNNIVESCRGLSSYAENLNNCKVAHKTSCTQHIVYSGDWWPIKWLSATSWAEQHHMKCTCNLLYTF